MTTHHFHPILSPNCSLKSNEECPNSLFHSRQLSLLNLFLLLKIIFAVKSVIRTDLINRIHKMGFFCNFMEPSKLQLMNVITYFRYGINYDNSRFVFTDIYHSHSVFNQFLIEIFINPKTINKVQLSYVYTFFRNFADFRIITFLEVFGVKNHESNCKIHFAIRGICIKIYH